MVNVGEFNLTDVPDDDIVKKYTAAPAKATNSEIEERLKRLKFSDTVNEVMEVKAKDFDKIVQFKTTRESEVKIAVDAGKSNPEGNVLTKEDLEVDQKCRDDFNRWFWRRQEEKEKRGKKFVTKGFGTSDSSFNELCSRGSIRKYDDNYHNYVGNSFESVNLGDETFIRSVGIQANISDAKNMVKNSSDFDDEE